MQLQPQFGEISAYAMGRIIGRTLHIEPKRAQRVGENVVLGAIFIVLVVVTITYS